MERRSFLRGALAIFGAAAAGATLLGGQAEAAVLDPKVVPTEPEVKPAEQVAEADTKELDAEGQYYYRRRRVYRRAYYRPRRVYRRAYYRPRRVYYRPRRVYYRPRFFF